MSLFAIARAYLWNRRWITLLTVLSILLGMSLISVVITVRSETEAAFAQQGKAYDLVVGAKGSPLQIVLNTIYHVGIPTGNIGMADYLALKAEPKVAAAYPMNLGDNFQGYRIVGTTTDFLTQAPKKRSSRHARRREKQGKSEKRELAAKKPFSFAEGHVFEKDFEVVAGWLAARQTGLKIGSTFVGAHGLTAGPGEHVHDQFTYTVVGILNPTGTANDRALFTTMASVWLVHEPHEEGQEGSDGHAHEEGKGEKHPAHHKEHKGHDKKEHAHEQHDAHADEREVTAVLVRLKSAMYRAQLLRKINDTYNAMAAVPVEEIKGLYDKLLNPIQGALLALGYIVVVVAAASVLISLYFSTIQRQRDLALMRVLGARPWELFSIICIEAFVVGLIGVATGIVCGHVIVLGIGRHLLNTYGLYIRAWQFCPSEFAAALIVLALGLVSAVLPGWLAYRTDVAKNLIGT